MPALNQFFGSDRKSRWMVITVSALITAGWGIATEASGKSVRDAQIGATLVGVLAFAAQVSFYWLKQSMASLAQEDRPMVYGLPRRLAFSAAILLLIGAVPAPLLEAAILRRRFRVFVQGERLSDLGTLPEVLDSARDLNYQLNPGAVSNIGFRILQDGKHLDSLDGQRALSAVLDYKSFLDSRAAPDTAGAKTDLMNSWIEINIHNPEGVDVGARQAPHVEHVGVAPESEGALMESLDGRFVQPPKRPWSPRFYVLTSKPSWGIQLDGMRYKNVIFKNSEIFYRSGPIELINVYFLNCRFTFYNSLHWSEFAKAILASSAVTFEISPRG